MSARYPLHESDPCRVCGGHPRLPKGQGIRCAGFRTADGWAHCTREERAGSLDASTANPPTYAHLIDGDCNCGMPHVHPGTEPFVVKPRPAAPVVAEPLLRWPIRDADGTVIAVHVRRPQAGGGKDYGWEQPNGTWGLNGRKVDTMLYGLELLATSPPEAPVILTEGEKSADALRSLGGSCVILGTVCGAPHAPGLDVLANLAWRKVYLWPDNDAVGREQMRLCHQRLQEAGCDEVRLIQWGEAEKDDGADFVARGGTLEQLRALAKAAKRVTDEPEPEDPHVVSWDQVPVEAVTWLWEPYIPHRKVTLLEGEPNAGKSFLALAVATSVTKGWGLPGRPVSKPGRVLFLSVEDGIGDTLRPRIERMGADLSRIHSVREPFTFDAAGMQRLDAALERYKPTLVVFDPLFAFFGGKVDLHRANETRAQMTPLYDRAMRHGCAILGIRHLSKGSGTNALNRGLGSIDITASVRSVILAGFIPDDPDRRRAIVHTKSNLAPYGEPLAYRITDGSLEWAGSTTVTAADILRGAKDEDDQGVASAVKLISTLLGDEDKSYDAPELAKALKEAGLGGATYRSALARIDPVYANSGARTVVRLRPQIGGTR